MNAPVSVDGGAGFDKLVILGTEYADHIVVTAKAIYGVGVSVTYANIEVLEIDALEGDDTIDVLSTAPGIVTRVIGGLGNDTLDVAGDVTGDVFSLDIEGTSGTINHARLVGRPELQRHRRGRRRPERRARRPGQRRDHGDRRLHGGLRGRLLQPAGAGLHAGAGARLVHRAPRREAELRPGVADADCKVYVTVSAAYPPNSEHPSLSSPYPDGPPSRQRRRHVPARDERPRCRARAADLYRQITLNGVAQQSRSARSCSSSTARTGRARRTSTSARSTTRSRRARAIVTVEPLRDPAALRRDRRRALLRRRDRAQRRGRRSTTTTSRACSSSQLDPNTGNPDNTTVALEGWGSTTDRPAIRSRSSSTGTASSLASAPTGTVVVNIELSDVPPDTPASALRAPTRASTLGRRVRRPERPDRLPRERHVYTVDVQQLNWFLPVLVDVHARNDFAPPGSAQHHDHAHDRRVEHRRPRTRRQRRTSSSASTTLVIDDENPGVFVLPSDGTTVVVACGNDACTLPPDCTAHPERATRTSCA